MITFKEQALDTVLNDLQESKTNILDNPFRLGSYMYFETIKEVRRLVSEGRYSLTEVDKQILETDIGEFEVYEGQLVALDCPMFEEEEKKKQPELNKPKAGGPKKYYVYVKDPKTGNTKKVNFGDPNMKIKKSNPKRRKSFRARHNCDNPGPKTKARYWSCRAW